MVSEVQPLLVDPSTPGSGVLNSVLALLSPPSTDPNVEQNLVDRDVAGFLVVYASLVKLIYALTAAGPPPTSPTAK